MLEEAGVEIKITKLVGIFNRTPFKAPVSVPEYVIVFEANYVRKVSKHEHEIISVDWVKETNIPQLSSKVTKQELLKFLQAAKQDLAAFD